MFNIKNSPKSIRYFNSYKIYHIFNYLEFRFKANPKGFWKFYEPCKKHISYREGDSIYEEIGMFRKVFQKQFSKIGIHYPSKQAFKKERDPFQGRLYATYYHRKDNKTYFFRNHVLVELTLKEIEQGNLKYQPVDNFVDKSVDKKTIQQKKESSRNVHIWPLPLLFKKRHNITPITRAREEPIQVSFPDRIAEPPREGEKIFKKMFDFWIATVEKDLPKRERTILTKWRCKELRERFQDSFEGKWEKWKDFCERIEANTFLMGGGPRGWKASLDWALRPENIEKVVKGQYTGQGATRSERMIQMEKEKPVTAEEIEGSELWKKFCVNLAQLIGPASFRAWFKEGVKPVDFEGDAPKIEFESNFKFQTISNRYRFQLENVLSLVLGKKNVKMEVRRR